MRTVVFLLLFFSAGFLQAAGSPDFPTLLKERLGTHPRLFLRAGEEKALLENPRSAELRAVLLGDAERLLNEPPVQRVLTGRRLLSVSRTALGRICRLSLAWRLTKDPRFRERAREEMLAVAAFTDWNPSHFLDVAEMTAGLAIGYDWLELDEQTGAVVRTAIVEKGIKPSFVGRQFWVGCTMNWSQVCHGGLALGALAVADSEPELAAQVLSRALANVPRCMEHSYAPDGAYPEGPSYWSYGTNYNVLLIAALQSALGSDFGLSTRPGFLASAAYVLHATGPSGRFHNYADCGTSIGLDPAMHWFAARNKDTSLLWQQEPFLRELDKARGECDRLLPFLLIWAGPALPIKPKMLDWSGGGATPVAFFRSGWDRDALFVGIKGGSPSESHGHMDVGSFVFEAQGVRWAVDLGMQNYHSLESRGVDLWNMKQDSQRWQVFRISNHSHNMLVFDEKLQNTRGRAQVVATGLHSKTPAALLDCSSIFAGQARKVVRTFSFPDRSALVVEDVVESVAADGLLRWQMATCAAVSVTGAEALLEQEGKTLRVRAEGPAQGIWSVVDISRPRNSYDAPNPGVRLLVLSLPIKAGDSPRLRVRLSP